MEFQWFGVMREEHVAVLCDDGWLHNVTTVQYASSPSGQFDRPTLANHLAWHDNNELLELSSSQQHGVTNWLTHEPCNQRQLVVMTYNMWNFNHEWDRRVAQLANIVRKSNPDIIGWQELRVDARRARHQLYDLSRAIPTHTYMYYQRGMLYDDGFEEGVGVMSRHPIIDVVAIPLQSFVDNEDGHQRVCLHATVVLPCGKRAGVLVTHLSLSHRSRPKQVAQIVELADRMRSLTDLQLVMGDFNAEPDHLSLSALLHGQNGFTDTWMAHAKRQATSTTTAKEYSGVPSYDCAIPGDAVRIEDGMTFPTWAPIKRIDYMLLRTAAHGKVLAEHVDDDNSHVADGDGDSRIVENVSIDGVCGWGKPRTNGRGGVTRGRLYASDHRAVTVTITV